MKGRIAGMMGLMWPLIALAQTAPDLVTQGDGKKLHGDFKGALTDYTAAIAADSRNVRAYLARGTVRSLEGNYDGAIADDAKAIALDPKNAVAYSNRGNARTSRGDLAGALADYTQAVALDPHHVRAFLNRGNVKNLQKNYRAAIADYTQVLTLEPKNAAAFYNRAGAERSLGDYAAATADYSQAIALNPVDVPAYLNRAVLQMAQGKWDAAETDLRQCLKLVSEERQAYPRIYLWVIEVKRGDKEGGLAHLNDYLQHSPKTYAATWGWQIAEFLAGKAPEPQFLAAAKSFAAKKDKGQLAQADYYIGFARAVAGDKAAARKFYRQCRKVGSPSLHEYILAGEELKGASQ